MKELYEYIYAEYDIVCYNYKLSYNYKLLTVTLDPIEGHIICKIQNNDTFDYINYGHFKQKQQFVFNLSIMIIKLKSLLFIKESPLDRILLNKLEDIYKYIKEIT